ncbi:MULTISPECIES: DUF6578 domain-containing protein [unclassified Rathayibacter]|uniref:DUF6578 domain-containing protein n=1 Tax=unclassified Rathayibacter TaxID=2609250 RepID=UPI00104ED321|nr:MULTISPECIES: DUF6578 domain-containing protein [unclassified Rathayibacter]TCL85424.1 hypothetical protein EDF49_10191 [Rathayibacter sp. PhB192]TCM31245.1 hypothetical protein EDF43_10191 [Rathayibacter sp. PhB179]
MIASSTRLIEVVREGWEMDCCGAPFAVGDRVAWSLLASPARPTGPARYAEEHHQDLPNALTVTGVVRGIVDETVLGAIPAIGEGVLVPDPSRRRLRRLASWDRSTGGATLRVALEIDADAELPPPWEPPESTPDTRMPDPEVVAALHALLVRLHGTWRGRVGIRSIERGRKASVVPHTAGAGELHWALGPEHLVVNLGYDRVILPGDLEGAARLEVLADEVSRGVARQDPPITSQGVLLMPARRRRVPTSAW